MITFLYKNLLDNVTSITENQSTTDWGTSYLYDCRWVTIKENLRNTRRIKLSLEIANEIKTLYNSGYHTQKEIAKKYNIDQGTISRIINNKNWSEI